MVQNSWPKRSEKNNLPLIKVEKTAKRVSLGLQCSANRRLRMPLLLTKEAAFSRCLVVISVKQICPLAGQRYRPYGNFYQGITDCIYLLP